MLMRFLRTASTGRLLGTIGAALVLAAACAAIAVAATGSGSTPPAATLAQAIHRALAAAPVQGVSADITFTDNLIDSSDFTGQGPADPLLQGATGRLWAGADGRLRIELQSGGGDAELVVDRSRWWLSDPAENIVYEGTLARASGSASGTARSAAGRAGGVPTVARIGAAISRVMRSLSVTGPGPTDVAGRPAYSVTVSPRTSQGLLGSLQLAWDAAHGTPLQFDVYARGDTTPVLGLSATSIGYGPVPASVFDISPPSGSTVVPLGDASGTPKSGRNPRGKPITGIAAVGSHMAVSLHPPATLLGQPRRLVRLIDFGGQDGALVLYGHGLGTVAAIEQRSIGAAPHSARSIGGVSLPTRRIGGGLATVLSTPLGTLLSLTRDGVRDTVIGSVTAAQAQAAAQQFARTQ